MLQPAHCSVFQLVVFILLYFSKLYFTRREVLEKNNRAQHVCVRRPWNLAADVFIIHHIMSVSRHVEAEHSKLASIKPNLKPKVTRLSSVSECVCVDCGRTGGHSFCQMERDWWSGLEHWPGYSLTVMAKKETAGLSTLGSVCACVHIFAALYIWLSSWRCIALFLKQQKTWGHEELGRLQENIAYQLTFWAVIKHWEQDPSCFMFFITEAPSRKKMRLFKCFTQTNWIPLIWCFAELSYYH